MNRQHHKRRQSTRKQMLWSSAEIRRRFVKPNKAGVRGNRENLTQAGGYVSATNYTLEYLIEKAYFPYHASGSPNTQFLLAGTTGWMNSEHFDIEAKAEGNPTVTQKQLMLRSLLEDRFKLALHHETRQLPMYVLVMVKPGKIGPQLIPHMDNANCVDPAAPTSPANGVAEAPLPLCGVFYISVKGGSAVSPEARERNDGMVCFEPKRFGAPPCSGSHRAQRNF